MLKKFIHTKHKMIGNLLKKKSVVYVLLFILVAFIGYDIIALSSKQTMPPITEPQVSVSEVINRNVIEWDEFPGRIEAVDRVAIRPRVGGTIIKIHFEEGQLVQKGDLLFTIDQQSYIMGVNSADAALALAKSESALANINFDRAKQLIKTKTIPQRDYDSSKSAKDSADASLKKAEAALDQARLHLEYTNISAPISGRISRAEYTIGNLVDGGGNAPILTTIVSVDPMYVSFDIDEHTYTKYIQFNNENADKIKQIQVQVTLPGDNQVPYSGFVKSFDNELNTHSGTVRARAVLSNNQGTLIPGLFVRVRIGILSNDKQNLITERAIGTDQNKKFVYIIDNENKVIYREIILGPIVDGGLRIARKGLNKGEKIVVNGLQRVRPGMVVSPKIVVMDTLSSHTSIAANTDDKNVTPTN